MPDPRAAAARYGIAIELADLGDWGAVTLVAEYDPAGPVIRLNERALDRSSADLAIAHELYHHREAIGEVPRLATRVEREAAAETFARAFVRTGAG